MTGKGKDGSDSGAHGHGPSMSSSRPYIVRALHEWIADNGLTPHLLVEAEYEGVIIPTQYIDNGKIVLNIAPMAVNCLVIDKYHVEFEARFRGIVEYIFVPMNAVLAIYAKENGRGMAFDEEPDDPPPPPPGPHEVDGCGDGLKSDTEEGKGGKGRGGKGSGSHLKVIK